MQALDFNTIPLGGTHLIEAGAGTGKTYTIGLLVLRLVLEKQLRMQNLALVTFTEAAAAELAERIIAFLDEARRCVDAETPVDSPVGNIVFHAHQGDEEKKKSCRAFLDRAVMELELARITTIHGFCSRLLHEFSFELGADRGFETITSEDELMDEILGDFWRNQIAPLDPSMQPLVKSMTPEAIKGDLREFFNFPGIRVLGPEYDETTARELVQARAQLERQWKAERELIHEMLTQDSGRFNQQSYKVERIGGYMAEVDEFFESDSFSCSPLERFTQKKLIAKINKKSDYTLPKNLTVPDRIGSYIEKFSNFHDQMGYAILKNAYDFLIRELSRRKTMKRVHSFNDLIAMVALGLEKYGESAAAPVRSRFSAVLVDEFQDTDRLQYGIFRRLFADREDIFFAMIGDPKQAIYRFRGGDIHAYLDAKRAAPKQNRHTLNRNFRSQEGLIQVLNRIYEDCKKWDREPFRTPDITHQQVIPGRKALMPATRKGVPLLPVTLWFDSTGNSIEAIRIARAVAAQIQELVHHVEIGEEGKRHAVTLGDIAVLVGSHRFAADIRKELAACGIRAVTGKSGSVLDSPEATDISLLLDAILFPSREPSVRALLLSPLFDHDLQRLTQWEQNEEERQKLHAELERCRITWATKGVARALDAFLTTYGIWAGTAAVGAERLAHDRRVTNFRHLVEILHVEDERLGRIPERTRSAYAALRRGEGGRESEQYEQRLESDGKAVQIVTMHKAKGLQWPVVFAVELWKDGLGPKNQKRAPIHHTQEGLVGDLTPENRPTIDAGTREEVLRERQRLAYVTLTRAESLLYVVTADRTKKYKNGNEVPDLSPAAWLLTGRHIAALKDAGHVAVVELGNPGRIAFTIEEPLEKVRAVERWSGEAHPRPRWEVGSYSRLFRGTDHALPMKPMDLVPPKGIFAFPRGAGPGTVLHTIFEQIDFMAVRDDGLPTEEKDKIAGILATNGLNTGENLDAVTDMVGAVLSAPILPGVSDFSLSKLPRSGRVVEMEFHLSAAHPDSDRNPLTREALIGVLGDTARSIPPDIRLAGFLTGFIDLVFTWKDRWYLLDWKSNHLGNSSRAYTPDAVAQAMDENNYHLQYLIYAVALCRHLHLAMGEAFDYDRHFGGVFYLFVRGIDGSRDEAGNLHGVFHTKPQRQMIEGLDGLF